jgi:hypothetical protein
MSTVPAVRKWPEQLDVAVPDVIRGEDSQKLLSCVMFDVALCMLLV